MRAPEGAGSRRFSMSEISEGYIPFNGYQTYYKVFGHCEPGTYPLVVLHGGPGMMHNYLLSIAAIAERGRAVVFYDQLGCGNSPADLPDDAWSEDLWCDELDNLRAALDLDEVHLLGQSCGGMLAQHYLLFHGVPEGVKSATLSSTMPSMKIWGIEGKRLRSYLSPEMQAAVETALATKDLSSPEYLAAQDEYYRRHVISLDPMPHDVVYSFENASDVYTIMQGQCEFDVSGRLRDWDSTDELHRIGVPVLLVSGNDDESTPLINKTMYDRIPDCRWELIPHGTHLVNAEFPEQYNAVVEKFLENVERR